MSLREPTIERKLRKAVFETEELPADKRVTTRYPQQHIEAADLAVAAGLAPTRSELLREALVEYLNDIDYNQVIVNE